MNASGVPLLGIEQTVPTEAYINDTVGQEFKAKFTNIGGLTAENVTVEIDLPDGGFRLAAGSLTAVLKNDANDPGTPLTTDITGTDLVLVSFSSPVHMEVGQILELTYKIATDATVTTGTHYKIKVTGKFDGNYDEDEKPLTVIAGAIKISFTPVSPIPFEAERGDLVTLNAFVENIGEGNLYGIDLETNWGTGFNHAEIVSAESNITPTLKGNKYQMTIDEIFSGGSKNFTFNLTVAEYEDFPLNLIIHNPAGNQTYTDSVVFKLFVYQPNISITTSDVEIDYGFIKNVNINITNDNASSDKGSAREFKLNTDVHTRFIVSNLSAGWDYNPSIGLFTYTGNAHGVIATDETVNLRFDIEPKDKYNTHSGTIRIVPEYMNDIDQTLNYPLASVGYKFVNVPTTTLIQDIETPNSSDGDNLRVFLDEVVSFEFRPQITKVEKWKENESFVFMDTFGEDFNITDVIVTPTNNSGLFELKNNKITWILTRDEIASNPVMTVKTKLTDDANESGTYVTNDATLKGWTIWDCNLSSSRNAYFYLQSRNEEAIFENESKYINIAEIPEGFYDVCGKDGKDIIQYRLEYNFHQSSGGRWTGTTLTDEMNRDQKYVNNSAQYKIGEAGLWEDVPSDHINSDPLTIDLGFLTEKFGGDDFVNGKSVSFRYQLQLTNESLLLESGSDTFISKTDLKVAGATGGAGALEDHFYQAVFVPISRALMDIDIDISEEVTIGETVQAKVNLKKITPWDNNNLKVTIMTHGNYQYLGNPVYSTELNNLTPKEVKFISTNPDIVEFTFQNNFEVKSNGTITFDLVKTDTGSCSIDAQLEFDDDLIEHFTDTAADTAYLLKGALSVTVNPDPVKIVEDTMSWDINISNIGSGTAYNVQLDNLLKNVMVFDGSSIDPTNTMDVAGYKNVNWDLGDLAVGQTKTITIDVHTSGSSTDFSNANNLSATADWIDRDGVSHQYISTSLNDAPKFISLRTYSFLKNSADSEIEILESGTIKLLVKNSGFTHNYNMILTQSLGQTGFEYIPGSATISGNAINDPVVISGTDLIWTFDSGQSNYLSQMENMAPGEEFTIEFDVKTDETFNEHQKIQPSATWQIPEETDGVLRSGSETGAEFRVPILQPKITVNVTGKNVTEGELSYIENVIASKNDTIIWRIGVENSGDVTAKNVILENTLPSNMSFESIDVWGIISTVVPSTTWKIENIPSNTKKYYYVTAIFDGDCGLDEQNIASVRWGAANTSSLTTPIDNEDAVYFITEPKVDVLTQTITDFTTKDGVVTITIENSDAPLYNVTLTDDITDRFVVDTDTISYSPTLPVPKAGPNKGTVGNALTWQWDGPIPAGTHTISFDIRDNIATDGASNDNNVDTRLEFDYKNSSGVAKTQVSREQTFDPKKANLTITQTPEVYVWKNGDTNLTTINSLTFQKNQPIWTIDITNTGDADATNVEIVNVYGDGTLNNGFTFISYGGFDTYTQTGNTIKITDITINAGETKQILMQAEINALGKHTSLVTATEYNQDKTAIVSESSAKAAVAVADIDVTFDQNTGNPDDPVADTFGEIVPFTITLTFQGDDSYKNAELKNTFPSGLEFNIHSFTGPFKWLGMFTPSLIRIGKDGFSGSETFIFTGETRIVAKEGLLRGDSLTNLARISFDIESDGEVLSFSDTLPELQNTKSLILNEPAAFISQRLYDPQNGAKVVACQEINNTLKIQNNPFNYNNVSNAYECKVVDTISVGARKYDPTGSLTIKKNGADNLTVNNDYECTYNSSTGKLTITFKNTELGILKDQDYFEINYKTEVDSDIGANTTITHEAQLIEYYGQPSGTDSRKSYTDNNTFGSLYETVESNATLSVVAPVNGEIKLGDIVTFKASMIVPNGTSVYDLDLNANLPAGLKYNSSVGLNDDSDNSVYRSLTPVLSGTTDSGQTITWASADQDITNNTGSDLTLTLTFDAVVLDSPSINDGDTLTTQFTYNYNTIDGDNSGRVNNTPRTVNLTVSEPNLLASMIVTSSGPYEAGNTVSYKVTIINNSTVTAYDVKITDTLPVGLTYESCDYPGVENISDQEKAWGSDGSIDIIAGDSLTLNINATIDVEVEPEQELTNNVKISWNSIDGDNDNERTYIKSLTEKIDITDSTALTIEKLGDPKYVIGETFGYRLVLTINKGTTKNVLIKNTLPNGAAYVSSTVTPDGSGNIDFTLTKPTEGDTGELVWDFGTISNSDTNNTVTIDFTVKILNITENQAGIVENNSAYVSYKNSQGDNTSTQLKAYYTINEPNLVVSKSFEHGNYQAGDKVNYTINVWHDSTSSPHDVSAYDVVIEDTIPEGMSYVEMNPAGSIDSGVLTWNIAEIENAKDINNPIVLTYSVILDDRVEPGEEFDESVDISWTSLSGEISGERTGVDGVAEALDNYAATDSSTLTVFNSTGLTNEIIGGTDYSIGEVVSYRLTLAINEGTTEGVVLKDTLPTGMEFESAIIAKGNANISYTMTGQPIAGDTGELKWNFGTVVNLENGNDTDDIITIEITAMIKAVVGNGRGTILTNKAQLAYVDGKDVSKTINPTTVDVTVIEPELQVVTELETPGLHQVGDVVTYKVIISHTADSNATAYDLKVEDIIPIGFGNASITANPDDPGTPVIDGNTLVWGSNGNIDLLKGETYTFKINLTLENEAQPRQLLSHDVKVNYSSLNGETDTERKYATTVVTTENIEVEDTTDLRKLIIGSGNLVPVGDHITFWLKLKINEGTTQRIVLKEKLPAGMVFDSAFIEKSNENITYVVNNDQIAGKTEFIWNFESIVNPGNTDDADDFINVKYTAIIKNVPANGRGKELINTTDLQYTDGEGNNLSINNKIRSVIIVEPELKVETRMITVPPYKAGDTVNYEIIISNTADSSGTAYDVEIIDVLPNGLKYESFTTNFGNLGAPVQDGRKVIWGGVGNIIINDGKEIKFIVNTILETGVRPGEKLTHDVNISYTSTYGENVDERKYATSVVDALNVIIDDATGFDNKISGEGTHAIGETVVYELSMYLTEGTTEGVVIQDKLPDGMRYDSFEIHKGNENISFTNDQLTRGASGELIWDLGTVQNPGNSDGADDFIVIEYKAVIENVETNKRGFRLENSAHMEYVDGEGNPHATEDQHATVTVIEPELKVESEIISGDSYQAGDIVTYKVTISHTDNSDANAYDVKITDILPYELSYDSYDMNPNEPGGPSVDGNKVIWGNAGNIDMNLGDTFTFNINATLDQEAKPDQILSNNIEVKYYSTDGVHPDEREHIITLEDTIDITVTDTTSLTKEVADGNHHAVGEPITFRLRLNLTEGTTEGVVIKDTLPVGMKIVNAAIVKGNQAISYAFNSEPETGATDELIWDFGTIINPGNVEETDDFITIEYTAVIQNIEENVRGVELTNTAHLEYVDGEGNGETTEDGSVTVIVIEPELTIRKAGPETIEPNTPATFTIKVKNIGDGTGWQTSIVDTLPLEMRETAPTIKSITVGNRILADEEPDDYDLAYDPETGEWIITLKSTEARIEIAETLTIVYEAFLNNEAFDVETITNVVKIEEYYSADISRGISDETRRYVGDGQNQNSNVDVTIHTPVITVVTEIDKEVAKPGDLVHYKAVLTNNGNIDATDLVFVDKLATEFNKATLSNLTSDSGEINVDAETGMITISEIRIPHSAGTVTIEWDVTLKPVLPSETVIFNQAKLTVPDYPKIVVIDFDGVTIHSAPVFIFELSDEDVNGSELDPGDLISYTLIVRNIGDENAEKVTVKDLIPSNTVYVQGTTTLNGETIDDLEGQSPLVAGMEICASEGTDGWLNVDQESIIELKVKVKDTVSSGTNISNQATLIAEGEGSGQITPILSDDPDTEVIGDATVSVVGNWPVIDVQKTVVDDNGDTVDPGDILTYTIIIANTGTAEATGVVYADSIPGNTELVPGSITIDGSNHSDDDDSDISCSVGIVAESATTVITFQVRIIDEAERAIIISQGAVSSNELPDELTDSDGLDINGDQPTEIVVGTTAVLRAFMQVSDINGGSVERGDILEYTISVRNIGNADATNVTIANPLPVDVKYISNTTSVMGTLQLDHSDQSSIVENGHNLGTISPNANIEVKFRVNVSNEVAIGTIIDNQATFTADQGITGISDSDLDDEEEEGNNAANPNDDDPTRVQIKGNPGTANISGSIWLDGNFNNDYDPEELSEEGWIVEVFQKTRIVDNAITDSNGSYEFTGITPGKDYRIYFRNPETNIVWKMIEGLTLLSGTRADHQDLPIQSTGLVYDAVTREPVQGAVVMIAGPAGFNPDEHLLMGQQNQVTCHDGKYRFDVLMSHGAPEGVYTISVTPPITYSPAFPSTIIQPEEGSLDPSGESNPCQVVTDITAPEMGELTTYYLSFDLSAGDPEIVNNHIPLDPILEDAILLTKNSTKKTATMGDIVPYTIIVENQTPALITPFTMKDMIPAGFKYVDGSARIDGIFREPKGEEVLAWSNLTLEPNSTITLTYHLVVGTGVVEGNIYRNKAIAIHDLTETNISNETVAEVLVVEEIIFSGSLVIGKVFNDLNGDGVQQQGEEGIQGVQIVSTSGLVVTTDAFGRYHIDDLEVGSSSRGVNFILKVDPTTLPPDFAFTTENPRLIRLTKGLLEKINFGVKLPFEAGKQ